MQTSKCYSDSPLHNISSTILCFLHIKMYSDLLKASLGEKHFIEIWSSKFTITHSTKWQCHTKFLLVTTFPKIITTVTFNITIVTVQDFIFFKQYKVFSTIKAIVDYTYPERLQNCFVFHTVHMHSWICNSTLCCHRKISDVMCDCPFSHFKNDHFAYIGILSSLWSVILFFNCSSDRPLFKMHKNQTLFFSNFWVLLCSKSIHVTFYQFNLILCHLKFNLKPTIHRIFICLLHIPLGMQIYFQ